MHSRTAVAPFCLVLLLLGAGACTSVSAPSRIAGIQPATGGPVGVEPAGSDDSPGGLLQVRFAGGKATTDVKSPTNISGDTRAGMFGLQFEAGRFVGGGVQLDFYLSDDDLFRDTLPTQDTRVFGFEFYPHLSILPGRNPIRVPIRIGPYLDVHSLSFDNGTTDNNVTFVGFGGQVEIEPEVDFFREEGRALSIYGRARVGVATAEVDADVSSNGPFSTDAVNTGFEAGLRWQMGRFLVTGGFVHRQTSYDQSETIGGQFVEETDFEFDGIFVSIGTRW